MNIERNQLIVIEHAENGGLIVSQHGKDWKHSQIPLGAFTTAKDMISALSDALERLHGSMTKE